MRKTFVDTLIELADKNNKISLLTGDLGFSVLESFREKHPDRFLNVGVSEQNLMGMAAGMALSGKTVFVYSIIPFVTYRCFEQIRNDVCMHKANVKIVGVGQGFSYSVHGHTHHAKEDVSILRSLPNMRIISPGDPCEVREAVKFMAKNDGPFYLRLGKQGEPCIHSKIYKTNCGQGEVLFEGKRVAVIASGNILANAHEAVKQLRDKKISVTLISMPWLKPVSSNFLKDIAKKHKSIITVEEHSEIGGLYSAISETLHDIDSKCKLVKLAARDEFIDQIGSQSYYRQRYNMSVDSIIETIKKLY